jgi:hypothetical protein
MDIIRYIYSRLIPGRDRVTTEQIVTVIGKDKPEYINYRRWLNGKCHSLYINCQTKKIEYKIFHQDMFVLPEDYDYFPEEVFQRDLELEKKIFADEKLSN